MTKIHLKHVNESYCKVECDTGILMELADVFTWKAENYKYHPKFKAGIWDGNISLVNKMNRLVYKGLSHRIRDFCKERDYTFSYDDSFVYDNISENELKKFITYLGLPEKLSVRDYQFEAVLKSIRSKRKTIISPTSSGKSLIIYIICMWYKEKYNIKPLIIVPTINLVSQMRSDFFSYGFNGDIHTSVNGLSKEDDIKTDVVITTWQSLDNGKNKVNKSWYNQFQLVVGDECHGAKATTLINILTNMVNTPYRFGTTGTLDNSDLNTATIEGLFGSQYRTTTTRELMDSGHATKLKIKCIVLKYPENVCKEFHKGVFDPISKTTRKKTYQEEVDFLLNYEARNNFIKNLTLSLDGNKLVFFRIKEHGDKLYSSLSEHTNTFYIDGDVKGSVREDIRKAIEEEENATLVASLGTTSTGVSINKLNHMIAAHPSKSKIKVLQSIGRMLRLHSDKEEAYLYDIVDDLSYKSSKNFMVKHFQERVKIYSSEKFPFKIYNTKI